MNDFKKLTKEEGDSLYNQSTMADVLAFIQRRFPKAEEDSQWVLGNCFYFASILKIRFPKGFLVYDVIDGHFLFLYHTLLVDAVHHEYIEKTFVPSDTNFLLTPTRVVWDFFKYYDSLQYERIIRDCIN